MKKVITTLLIVWGVVMSVCTIALMHDVRVLRDIARGEVDLMDARENVYKHLFFMQANAIDDLNNQIQLQQQIIDAMRTQQKLKDQSPIIKGKGISL